MIIGITGTLGSGKGTVVEFLKEHGFTHISARAYMTEFANERGMPILGRETFHDIANNFRKISPTYLADAMYAQAQKIGTNCVIESLHTGAEVESLRAKGNFILFAVDADMRIRYDRITSRKTVTDNVSFEEFARLQEIELASSNPNEQNLGACIKMADYTFLNNGSKEELKQQVETALGKI